MMPADAGWRQPEHPDHPWIADAIARQPEHAHPRRPSVRRGPHHRVFHVHHHRVVHVRRPDPPYDVGVLRGILLASGGFAILLLGFGLGYATWGRRR
jgi:hypothetical protein